MSAISKAFGPVTVLEHIDFELEKGSLHAICGENGAGKSTLMKVLSGVHAPTSGTMTFDGQAYSPANPLAALDAGVSMIYQELDLAEDLTVSENIFLGREITRGGVVRRLDHEAMRQETTRLIEQYDFKLDADALIRNLSVGEAQVVELLKAIHRQAKVVVMDEPTSALSEQETERLFAIIGELKKQDISIIYISHRMEEIQLLADYVSVLRDGRMIWTRPKSEVTIEAIIQGMVGRELKDFYPARQVELGMVMFEAVGLADGSLVKGVDLQVRAGEIVGMAGLVGAGRTETANLIFGVTPKVAGELKLHGRELIVNNPGEAIRAKIAYLTEDRKRNGLCLELSCAWNMTLPNLDLLGMSRKLELKREQEVCADYGARVKVKWQGPEDSVNQLSGGNQQKVLLGRWLMAESEFLIFDEPTRGIDVGAKKEVYMLLNELAAQGKAILLISSELPEIFGVCDQIIVMREGRVAARLETKKTTPEEVMKYATVNEE